ncbi:MAG TPA: phosphopantetheine-binding protein [Fibrobacteria bacterium]|nr:phosphopantetheine-binding protein [Fibrobacteria bacterium]
MLELELEIKELIISTLKLEEVSPGSIDPEAAIFGEGLGLDSIDALELGIAIQKRYGIRMSSDSAENRAHFSSVRKLAAFVENRRAPAAGK